MSAEETTWIDDGWANTWNTSNWTNGAPGAGDVAIFARGATVPVAGLLGQPTFGELRVTTGSLAFTASGWGGGSLSMNGNGATPVISVANGASAAVRVPLTGNAGVNKTGVGTLTLGAANTFTGQMDVQAGTVAYGVSNAINNLATVRVSGGSLGLGSYSDTVAGVTLTSGSINGTGTLTCTTAFQMLSGTVSATLAGTHGLIKSGSGTLTLSGANTYTGDTLVNAGTLLISGTGSLSSSSPVRVASGAVLAGDGRVGQVTVEAGGTVTGKLKMSGSTQFTGTGNHDALLTTVGGVGGTSSAPTGAPGGADQLDLSAANLTITDGFKVNIKGSPQGFAGPGIYNWLIMAVNNVGTLNWDGIKIGTVSFGSPSEYSIFAVDNASGSDYIGVSYSYSAVPEATTLLLGMAGLMPVLLQRRGRAR